MPFDSLFETARPALPIRGIHLDLKGTPPTAERLLTLLDVFAAARYNAILVEWEDAFPWTVDERFRSETCYSRDEVGRFLGKARELGMKVIPLVQCLGHMETPLSVEGNEHLREVPHKCDVLNPLAPGATELVQKMVDDVLAVMPDVEYFHLGGDEAWSLGTHPDTKAYIEESGKGALYMRHVGPILDSLKMRNIRPILWHDMMREWDDAALDALAEKADLLVWGYQGHPDRTEHHYSKKVIERFSKRKITMWGGAAYKGADGQNSDVPNLENRQANARAWVEVARRYGFRGVIATGWSRYSTHRMQCEPIDAALDSAVNVGVILHDGKAPNSGIEGCIAALEEIGEKERFFACKAAMQELAYARRGAWDAIALLHEATALAKADKRRRGTVVDYLVRLRSNIRRAEDAAQAARRAFDGLMQSLWLDRYLAERIDGLVWELQALEERVKALDPTGYAAEVRA